MVPHCTHASSETRTQERQQWPCHYANWIFTPVAQTHVYEALIDGELLQYRRVLSAYLYEFLRTSAVPVPVSLDYDEIGTFPQCHRRRFGGLDADLLGRMDAAVMMLRRSLGSPETTDGTRRIS